MKNFRNLFIILLLLSFSFNAKGQVSTYNGIGFSVGPTAMLGDWGRSNEFTQSMGYSGGSFEVHHLLKFVRYRSVIRTSLGFSYIGLKHTREEWTDNEQLASMSGTSTMVKLGTRYELNFLDYGLYYPRDYWTPYVAIGIDAIYYNPSVETTFGDGNINNESNLPSLYRNGGIFNDSGITAALKGAVGVKFKVNRQLSMFAELELSRMFSDEVDGLMPEEESVSVDYTNNINIGLTYYIY